jgi:hypothetical protein
VGRGGSASAHAVDVDVATARESEDERSHLSNLGRARDLPQRTKVQTRERRKPRSDTQKPRASPGAFNALRLDGSYECSPPVHECSPNMGSSSQLSAPPLGLPLGVMKVLRPIDP